MTFHKTLEWFGWEDTLKLAIPTPLVLPGCEEGLPLLLLSVLAVVRPSLAGAQCSPGSWVRITAAAEICSPKRVQWDLQTSASACSLSGMSPCPAAFLPILFPFLCPFFPVVPEVLQMHVPGHVLSPSLWTLGFFCLSSNSPGSLAPCLCHSWPLLCAPPGDFALSSRCHCRIWYLAKDQVKLTCSEPNPHKSHVLHGAQSLVLCCRGSVVPSWWRGHQDKTLHCVFRRAEHIHGYSSSKYDNILKRPTLLHAVGKPVLKKEKGVLGVWISQQHLGPALSAQKRSGLNCVKPRTGINPPKRPFPWEFSMFYFRLIISL